MDRRIGKRADYLYKDERTDKAKNERIDGRTVGMMDGRMEGQTKNRKVWVEGSTEG